MGSKLLSRGLVESSDIPAAWPSALGPGAGTSVLLDYPLEQDTWQECVQKWYIEILRN